MKRTNKQTSNDVKHEVERQLVLESNEEWGKQ